MFLLNPSISTGKPVSINESDDREKSAQAKIAATR
jgi:hypothetical protein